MIIWLYLTRNVRWCNNSRVWKLKRAHRHRTNMPSTLGAVGSLALYWVPLKTDDCSYTTLECSTSIYLLLMWIIYGPFRPKKNSRQSQWRAVSEHCKHRGTFINGNKLLDFSGVQLAAAVCSMIIMVVKVYSNCSNAIAYKFDFHQTGFQSVLCTKNTDIVIKVAWKIWPSSLGGKKTIKFLSENCLFDRAPRA